MLSKVSGGSLDDRYLSQNRSEVGVVGAVESCAVAEVDMKGSFPPLRGQVELVYSGGVRDGHVGTAVHYSWFVDLGGHARG